jgi:Phage integrase family.
LEALRDEVSDPRTKALVWILSETGIRAGEVIRLDRDDVRFDPETTSTVAGDDVDVAATVEIDRQKRGEIVTDRRPLSDKAAEAVDEYLGVIDEYADADAVASPGLFVTPFQTELTSAGLPSRIEPDGVDASGTEYTWRPTGDTINQWLKKLADQTDYPDLTADRVHTHLFRHTLGTKLGEKGYSGDQIGAFLGRASAAEEYVHLDDSGVVVDMAQAAP